MPVGCAGNSKVLLQSYRPTTLLSLRIREFDIRILAHMLNSLVRVSRREKENHLVQRRVRSNNSTTRNVYVHERVRRHERASMLRGMSWVDGIHKPPPKRSSLDMVQNRRVQARTSNTPTNANKH